MAGEQEAIAAVIDHDGKFLGTGFFSRGVLITCAHVIESRERVQAQFGTERARKTIAFRRLKVFPRRRSQLCDEPDARCDIAILRPETKQSRAGLPNVELAARSARGGEVAMRGHAPDSRGGRILVPVRATIDAQPQPNGWRLATPLVPVTDAPSAGMSGGPVFHDHITGAIGMLAMGQEEGRALWLVIPAEALQEAIADALGDAEADNAGPRLALTDIEMSGERNYAYGEIHAPRQTAQCGAGVSVMFLASFGPSPGAQFPQLREVEIALSIPQHCRAVDVIGGGQPYDTEMGVSIRWRGSLRQPRWQLAVFGNGQALHGCNVEVNDPPLFRMPDAEAGQRIRFEMIAYANKNCFSGADLPDVYAPPKSLSRAAQQIIRRLNLKAIAGPDDDGALILYATDNEVIEVEQ